MQFASASSRLTDPDDAVQELLGVICRQITTADLIVLFVTSHHRYACARIGDQLRSRFPQAQLVGCTCEGVIGGSDEIETEPGVSVLVGNLDSAECRTGYFAPSSFVRQPEGQPYRSPLFDIQTPNSPLKGLILLCDPFSTPMDTLLSEAGEVYPGVPIIGGIASGSRRERGNAMLVRDELYTDGVIWLGLYGEITVETIVSQGCRPIGPRLEVTEASDGCIKSLSGRPALEQFVTLFEELSGEDQDLLLRGLLIGLSDETRVLTGWISDSTSFLIRSVLGFMEEDGSLVLGQDIEIGQTVQFHVRDRHSAHEDLVRLLRESRFIDPAVAALMFTCNGRGINLFEAAGHDLNTVHAIFPDLPTVGFFAAGEVGPVHGSPQILGFTASIGLVRPS